VSPPIFRDATLPRHAGAPIPLFLHAHSPSKKTRTQVNDFVADAIISQMLLLDAKDPTKVRERLGWEGGGGRVNFFLFRAAAAKKKLAPLATSHTQPQHARTHRPPLLLPHKQLQDIKLFINSPGGSVTAGLGIYDGMQMARAPVATYCFGLAASMGAFLLCAGAKGKRHAMPNARIMIHQPLGGASGQAVDIEIQAKEIMFHKANLNRIMAAATGKTVDQIDADTDRDRYMSALEAKRYGLIDHVIGGDDAGFKIEGDLRKLPKTKAEYVSWGKDGDDGSRSSRFLKPLEPFVKPFKDE
jgi:ATP-dependent Clp protease, protease subunit